jgi:hypothetical protein
MIKHAEWLPLFKLALNILSKERVPGTQWSFGGGTALMTYYNHRRSKDIDIFLRDVQLLTKFTPRLNDYVSERVDDYSEMSNFLKLKIKKQEIDFIVAPFLTKKPTVKKLLANAQVYIESPEEIIVKKIFYRAESFKTRDVFDLAVVIRNNADALMENIAVYQDKLDVLQHRLEAIKPVYEIELKALDILDHRIAKESFDIVCNFIDEIQ